MAEQKFSKAEAFRFGWDAMKNNLGFFIGLLIVVGLIQYAPAIAAKSLEKDHKFLAVLINLISSIINIIISIGLVKIVLKLYDKQEAHISDLFSCRRLFFRYLFGSLLYGLVMVGGFILLIIPGIIFSVRCGFFGYLIVDKGMGPLAALKKSYAMTKGSTWNLCLFSSLVLGVIILGFLALVVGLFAAIPLTMMAIVFVYRALAQEGV